MSPQEYLEAAAEASNVSATIIASHQRRGAHWLHAAMWLAYEDGWTTTEIGRAYDRDHTTVCYGIRKAKPELVEQVRAEATGQGFLIYG